MLIHVALCRNYVFRVDLSRSEHIQALTIILDLPSDNILVTCQLTSEIPQKSIITSCNAHICCQAVLKMLHVTAALGILCKSKAWQGNLIVRP